ncbi:MAG: HigA family addiction module antitoxin [Flavobacteriales bacterium]|nr:HigA family addiction module antitoxin [Flavobacteriales bacterium]
MKTANEITPTEVTHPGEFLAEEIVYRGLTKKYVAELMGLSPTVLSEIISGKRNITAITAIKLEHALEISALYWLNLQTYYDYYTLKWSLEDAQTKRRKVA